MDTTTSPTPSEAAKLSEYATGKPERIHRSQLKNAPYNPRGISDRAKKKLRASIKRVGLIDLPVWNRRTGNIIGGHQRISQLDTLEGTKEYELYVSAVDLDEKTEKEQNIALNNPELTGFFDLGKLGVMFQDGGLTTENTGFDDADVYQMFGAASFADEQDKIDQMAERIKAASMIESQSRSAKINSDMSRFYIVVVFASNDDCLQFLDDCGLKRNRYVSGAELRRYIWDGDSDPEPDSPSDE